MIQVHKTQKEISFNVSGETYQQITQWIYAIDETVFKEQLATGRFGKNIEIDPDMLMSMRNAEKQGRIRPYYGTFGRACTYRFRVRMSRIELTVEHGATVMSLDTPLETSERSVSVLGEPPKALVCKIAERDYEKLAKWPKWVDAQALSERYQYSFSEVSIGTGFVAEVKDTESGDFIDIYP